MLLFTDFIADDATVLKTGQNLKHQLGWSFLAIIGTNLCINFAIILREVILKIIKHVKDKKMKNMKIQLDEKRAEQIKIEEGIKIQQEVARKANRRMRK